MRMTDFKTNPFLEGTACFEVNNNGFNSADQNKMSPFTSKSAVSLNSMLLISRSSLSKRWTFRQHEVNSDVWLGLRRGVPRGVYNASNSEWRHPLRTSADSGAVYARGDAYDAAEGVDFAALMAFGWRRDCLHLRAALDYRLRDGGCDLEKAFICEWKGALLRPFVTIAIMSDHDVFWNRGGKGLSERLHAPGWRVGWNNLSSSSRDRRAVRRKLDLLERRLEPPRKSHPSCDLEDQGADLAASGNLQVREIIIFFSRPSPHFLQQGQMLCELAVIGRYVEIYSQERAQVGGRTYRSLLYDSGWRLLFQFLSKDGSILIALAQNTATQFWNRCHGWAKCFKYDSIFS